MIMNVTGIEGGKSENFKTTTSHSRTFAWNGFSYLFQKQIWESPQLR